MLIDCQLVFHIQRELLEKCPAQFVPSGTNWAAIEVANTKKIDQTTPLHTKYCANMARLNQLRFSWMSGEVLSRRVHTRSGVLPVEAGLGLAGTLFEAHRLSSVSSELRAKLPKHHSKIQRCVHDSLSREYSSCDPSDPLMAPVHSPRIPLPPGHSSLSSLPPADVQQHDSSPQNESNG